MENEQINDENISQVIAYIADRINLVFSHFFCLIEFEGDKDFKAQATLANSRAVGLRVIASACLHTSLIAMRDLDDVLSLRTSQTKTDDIRISDFGATRSLSFLNTSERGSINKAIAHATFKGMDLSHRWDVLELMTKCVLQALEFLKWLEENSGDRMTAVWCRAGIESTFEYVNKKVREIRIMATL